MMPEGQAAAMRPTEAWARMAPGVQDQMIVCLHLPGHMQLCAFGGQRLALRLGDLGPSRPVALRGSWTGITTSLVAREHDAGQHYLFLEGQAGYSSVFGHLADELHAAIQPAVDPEDIPRRMLGVLQLWSGFLARGRAELDRTAALGLYAELALLEQVVAPRTGWKTAMTLWTGPEGAPQDLTGNLLLEVKSTSPDSQNATISSIDQLDPPDGRPVWVAQALREATGADSLLSIRDRILAACASEEGEWPVPARLRLLQAGLLGLEEDHTGMGIAVWRFHRTDSPGFPVLRKAGLPGALIRATYVIDLSACPEQEGILLRLQQALDAERPVTERVGEDRA